MKILLFISVLCTGELISTKQYPDMASCEIAAKQVDGFKAQCIEIIDLKHK